MTPQTCLYFGRVMHARLKPVRHRFTYRVFSLFADLDEIAAAADRLRLLSVNRPGVLSFRESDHGDGTGSLAAWVRRHLAAAGFRGDGKIFIQCYPRMFGYVFNPLSVYYCYDSTGRLEAVLHQVNNTFGDRHSYLLAVEPAAEGAPIRQSCAKRLYVSPFNAMEHRYDFTLHAPCERYVLHIRERDAAGDDVLVASFNAQRRALSDETLFKALLAHPLMTFKVIGAIHWQALRLWRKGVPVQKRAAAPVHDVSYGDRAALAIAPRRCAARGTSSPLLPQETVPGELELQRMTAHD